MSASTQVGAFNYAVPPFGNLKIKNITAAYLVSPSDNNFIINCTANTFTISLPPASSLPIGYNVTVWNTSSSSSDAVTIDPNGTETIDSVTTLILRRGEGMQIVCNGTNWDTGNKKVMRGYAENVTNSQARPVASGNLSLALGGYVNASTASGAGSLAIHGSATNSQGTAIGLNSAGSLATVAVNAGAMALGGSYASGTDSFAAVVADNTSTYGAQGSNSIAIGRLAKATVTSAIAIGDTTQATGSGGYCLAIGYQSQATSPGAIAIGFQYYGTGSTLASGGSSVAIGDHVNATERFSFASGNGALAAQIGKEARASGFFAAIGDAQYGQIVLRIATTDATATRLTSNAAAAGTTNQVILPNNSAFAFTGIVVARQQAAGGSNYAAWEIKGAIIRDANAASTTLGSININALSATAGASAWVVALTADTTNGGLAITVTGVAATNIRWVATVNTSEVTYA